MRALTLIFATLLIAVPSTTAQNQAQGNDVNNQPGALIGQPACAADLRKYCETRHLESDMAALECLQDAGYNETITLSEQCEQLVWEFKVSITTDERFRKAIVDFCKEETAKNADMAKCAQQTQPGYALSCMIEFVRVITPGSKCYRFLAKLGN
ncbi:hypothetical protein L596_001282 [Steinernema carpocapsae]|uniref:Uncharacterized protein n=1 Tax=Steinernema carpocapsae TaxID=34508 RepID=A0A4V6I7C4_STECR|nr:hypothetical protein L596_001282 [Steinernema carpocapsae]